MWRSQVAALRNLVSWLGSAVLEAAQVAQGPSGGLLLALPLPCQCSTLRRIPLESYLLRILAAFIRKEVARSTLVFPNSAANVQTAGRGCQPSADARGWRLYVSARCWCWPLLCCLHWNCKEWVIPYSILLDDDLAATFVHCPSLPFPLVYWNINDLHCF